MIHSVIITECPDAGPNPPRRPPRRRHGRLLRARLPAHPDGGRGAPPRRLGRARSTATSRARRRSSTSPSGAPSARRSSRPHFPLPTPAPRRSSTTSARGMRRRLRTPGLVEAASRAAPEDVGAELAALLVELYDVLAANASAIRLIERSVPDRPELAALYFGRGRGGLVERWRRYLERRIGEGRLRAVPDVAIAARLVIETVAWFAWHRLGDPIPQPMDAALVRETVVAVLSRGLLPGGPPVTRFAALALVLPPRRLLAGLRRSAGPSAPPPRAARASGPRTAATRAARASRRSPRSRRENVARLEVAWTYHTGDSRGRRAARRSTDRLRGHADPRRRHALRAARRSTA